MKKGWFKDWKWWASFLVMLGAINWGLVGLFDFNLLTWLFGVTGWLTKTLYILVGVSGIVALYNLFKK